MHEDEIEGLKLIKTNTFHDERGSFTRLYDCEQLQNESLIPKQMNISRNPFIGTLRGMHYQVSGDPEHKIMTLLSGSAFLVIIDMRKGKSSFLKVASGTISAADGISIFIPAGCAAGWLSLSPNTDIHYVMYSRYENNSYDGLRYNDPHFNISWPSEPKIISEQDKNWPLYSLES